MPEIHHFVKVAFHRFKAFRDFTLNLRKFNILVGPNNAGKSTVLAAFRILSSGIRKARRLKPELVSGPRGDTLGYSVDMGSIAVAQENIFYNYDDSEAATVQFNLSNRNSLLLYFRPNGKCSLIPMADKRCTSPTTFQSQFNCQIGFAPILGPVDHREALFEKEAARNALHNYTASRNFRNIWFHYPEKFEEFRNALKRTWPGMDIEKPFVEYADGKGWLNMFCPEDRIPREICWSGFGFQVWCQMLTHLIQGNDRSLFLIDEPDIYLHSDLQRQLFGLLRNLGPDILIATHSTEIITEADPDDLVIIDKRRGSAKRINNPTQISEVFGLLGSSLNPVLTQLAKTRRVVFVEGKDFQVLGRFAQRLGFERVGTRAAFAVIPTEGFNPERIRNLVNGMEATLGSKVSVSAILDRDYRSDKEITAIEEACRSFCDLIHIHKRKEIENFLLVPAAIDRAAKRRLADRLKRVGGLQEYTSSAASVLESLAQEKHSYVMAQRLASRRRFERTAQSGVNEATYNEIVLKDFAEDWKDLDSKLRIVPGKDALAAVNQHLQQNYSVNVTPTAIIDAMTKEEIPEELQQLMAALDDFAKRAVAE